MSDCTLNLKTELRVVLDKGLTLCAYCNHALLTYRDPTYHAEKCQPSEIPVIDDKTLLEAVMAAYNEGRFKDDVAAVAEFKRRVPMRESQAAADISETTINELADQIILACLTGVSKGDLKKRPREFNADEFADHAQRGIAVFGILTDIFCIVRLAIN